MIEYTFRTDCSVTMRYYKSKHLSFYVKSPGKLENREVGKKEGTEILEYCN